MAIRVNYHIYSVYKGEITNNSHSISLILKPRSTKRDVLHGLSCPNLKLFIALPITFINFKFWVKPFIQ